MTDAPQRFFFVHLLKTAGTTLFVRLGGDPEIPLNHIPSFTEAEIYPNATDGDLFTVAPQLSVEQLLDRWEVRAPEIRIVMGHFPVCTTDLLGVPFTTLTVLREPVDRTLSFLRHHKKLTPEDRDLPLVEIYEDDFRFEGLIRNHMVKMFGMTAPEMDSGMLTRIELTPEHLERAKRRLEAVDVLGLQDRFEEFCQELEARFGWVLGEPMVTNESLATPVPESFRERIASDNALDVELYEFAREIYRSRRRLQQPAP